MSNRRISKEAKADIGAKRIERLLDLSEESVRIGREDRARRYVEIARNIGMKMCISLPKNRRYCKNCLLPMMPGVNCTVRLANHKVNIRCDVCGEVRRIPYIKEQRI